MKGMTFHRVSSAASSIEQCEADDIPVVQPFSGEASSGRPRTALVTGASGGIGCELARSSPPTGTISCWLPAMKCVCDPWPRSLKNLTAFAHT